MITKYIRKIKEDEIIEVLITAYINQCLSHGTVEYITGSANTIGFIVGALGIEPSYIPEEAKRRKKMEVEHE